MKRICIFDYDGTLCNTPTKPANWVGGWWGKKESLLPPFVTKETNILNQTVADAYNKAKNDPDCLIVMMTGRHEGIKKYVLDILARYGIHPKENDSKERAIFTNSYNTLQFKIDQIYKLLREFPRTEIVEIWEDREAHIEEFRKLGQKLKHITFVVHTPPNWHLD